MRGEGVIRVVVADDHALVREGLLRVLKDEPDIEVVAESDNGDDLVDLCRDNAAHVAVLDISMPGPDFVDLLKVLGEALPELAVLILSVHPEGVYAQRAFRAGAAGYMHKEQSTRALAPAIRRVSEGGRYLSPALAEKLLFDLNQTADRPRHETLSERELDVFLRLAVGRSQKSVAFELGLSPKTVSTYRSRVLRKLGLDNDAELVRYALVHGLVE